MSCFWEGPFSLLSVMHRQKDYQRWSWLVSFKKPESTQSESEIKLSKNALHSKTRPRTSKNGLKTGPETKTDLEYYNTSTATAAVAPDVHVLTDEHSGVLTTSELSPIYELGLHFDLSYTPVTFCDCILHCCDTVGLTNICPQTVGHINTWQSVQKCSCGNSLYKWMSTGTHFARLLLIQYQRSVWELGNRHLSFCVCVCVCLAIIIHMIHFDV